MMRLLPALLMICSAAVPDSMLRAVPVYRSPQALAVTQNGLTLYAAEAGSHTIAVIQSESGTIIKRIALPAEPTGLVLTPGDSLLYATCASPAGLLCEVDPAAGTVLRTMPVGHGARAPVLSADARQIYVCSRFTNEVCVVDVETGRIAAVIPGPREPFAAVLSTDGRRLFVAGHLPAQPSNERHVAAEIAVIDVAQRQVTHTILLPNGSTGIRGLAMAPDGKYLFASHILARYTVPTSQLEQGWMNTNALSVIDAETGTLTATVLLDQADYGAANPWGVACTSDGQYVCVAHAGTHEISVIGYGALIRKLAGAGSRPVPVSQDLSFLYDLRQRLALPGNGPRAVAACGSSVFVAGYFSDTVVRIALDGQPHVQDSYALSPPQETTPERRGEMYFNDASICFQQWQSCASCHPDARVDGLNWDLLNDGIGNPKNALSMVLAPQTPPSMSTGIRANAEACVRAGIRYIHFAVRPEAEAQAIDAFLKSLEPVPSPWLVRGTLSPAAERGRRIFNRADVACQRCHVPPLFTTLASHNVGTHAAFDFTTDAEGGRVPQTAFDTPTLVEVWRTAPYLHDGRYATIGDLLQTGRHGLEPSVQLSEQELQDLILYVLSL